MAALNRCIFSRKSGQLSAAGPKRLGFGSYCSVNFQSILDCFIPNFKLKYEDSENILEYRVNIVVFNLRQINRGAFFGTPGIILSVHFR